LISKKRAYSEAPFRAGAEIGIDMEGG